MKTKLILIAVLFATLQLQSNAAVSVDQSTSKGYLVNSGYSRAFADSIEVQKHRSLGEQYYTDAERRYRNDNGWVKFWKKTNAYFDPAADDFSFYHHDIHVTPSIDDL